MSTKPNNISTGVNSFKATEVTTVQTAIRAKLEARKDGSLRDMANAREYWLDVQARALFQAANRVCKYFNA